MNVRYIIKHKGSIIFDGASPLDNNDAVVTALRIAKTYEKDIKVYEIFEGEDVSSETLIIER